MDRYALVAPISDEEVWRAMYEFHRKPQYVDSHLRMRRVLDAFIERRKADLVGVNGPEAHNICAQLIEEHHRSLENNKS